MPRLLQQYPPYAYPPYPYAYAHPHFLYGHPPPPTAAGLPPLPKAQHAQHARHAYADVAEDDDDELAPAGSAINLVVRGTNRPFAPAAAAGRPASVAAALEAQGQEQVNILNLPLPEVDSQVGLVVVVGGWLEVPGQQLSTQTPAFLRGAGACVQL